MLEEITFFLLQLEKENFNKLLLYDGGEEEIKAFLYLGQLISIC